MGEVAQLIGDRNALPQNNFDSTAAARVLAGPVVVELQRRSDWNRWATLTRTPRVVRACQMGCAPSLQQG